ncbi:UDP-galactose transporter [Ramicandelaber brevisporus]|nr:UDP-galactose transporter [Ramicandelaber brevisporus]
MEINHALAAVLPIIAYCSASILMTVVNKIVMSKFEVSMTFLVLAIQSLASVLFLVVFRTFGTISFRPLQQVELKQWFPVSVSMAVMLYTGGKSLQYLNVPIFTIFKNMTIILVAFGEFKLFGSPVTPLMLTSFLLMVLSSVIGGWNDLQFNLVGYVWMAFNCASTAFFTLHIRRVQKLVGFKDFDTVYYNNTLLTPMFIVMSLITEDWSSFIKYYADAKNVSQRNEFVVANLISGCAAFAISYCSSWCIRMTTSTTYSMVGALNKLPIALFSMVYFGDKLNFGGILALIVGFSAGLVYSHAKNVQKKEQDAYKAMNNELSDTGAHQNGNGLPAPVSQPTKY